MLPEINSILEVFEQMSIDEKAYFSFNNEEEIQVCISFIKKSDKKNWSIWYALNEHASKQTTTLAHLRAALKAFKINEKMFINEISEVLLVQAAFADEFIRQISNILGKEAVQKAILSTQNFMDELSSKIKLICKGDNLQSSKTTSKLHNKNKLKIIK